MSGAATWTPGPWRVRDDYTREGSLTIIGDVDGEYFTDSAGPVMSYQFVANLEDEYGETHDRTDANLRLISAAPDMASALREIASMHWGILGNIARAALAKAEGQS